MYGQEKRRNSRSTVLFLDWVHIVIGVCVVALAVVIFLNPEKNQWLLPAVFCLAAAMNLLNGLHRYRQSGRDKRKKAAAAAQFVIAVLLAAVTVISAISIWR